MSSKSVAVTRSGSTERNMFSPTINSSYKVWHIHAHYALVIYASYTHHVIRITRALHTRHICIVYASHTHYTRITYASHTHHIRITYALDTHYRRITYASHTPAARHETHTGIKPVQTIQTLHLLVTKLSPFLLHNIFFKGTSDLRNNLSQKLSQF